MMRVMNADALATKLTDAEVLVLDSVVHALNGGPTPDLTFEQWCWAETILNTLEGSEVVS